MTADQRVFEKVFSAVYRGDCRDFDPDRLCGPNTLGEHFFAERAEYDSEKNETRIFYQVATLKMAREKLLK